LPDIHPCRPGPVDDSGAPSGMGRVPSVNEKQCGGKGTTFDVIEVERKPHSACALAAANVQDEEAAVLFES